MSPRRWASGNASYPISGAQDFHLSPFRNGHDEDSVTLERVNVETFPQNAADPPVRDRPVVFFAIALNETGRYVGDGYDGTLGGFHEFGEDFQYLGFQQQPSLRYKP